MTTRPSPKVLLTAGLLAGVLVVTDAVHQLMPRVFDPLAARVTDLLFQLRSNLDTLGPPYDGTVVHVDVDDRSLREVGTFYLDRRDHAQLVLNLGRAGVALQLHDMIFAAPQDEEDDRELARATLAADNVYYGMALGLAPGAKARPPLEGEVAALLDAQRWRLEVRGDPESLLSPTGYFPTFSRLASVSRGLGFLDIMPDHDGVYRRTPLLVRDGDGFLPSMALLVACDYLGVSPDRIELQPGKAITLRGARRPDSEASRDIAIPIDREGRTIVNYAGPWGRMTHYPFSGVYAASDDRFMMEDLRDELEGKIAIVSWVATGGGDVGSVPTDSMFPMSGVHANVVNSILAGRFLRELSPLEMFLWVEVPLMGLFLLAAVKLRTIHFLLLAVVMILAFHGFAVLLFLYGDLIVNVPRPVMLMVGATMLVAAYQYHIESEARAVLRNTFDAYFPPSVVDKIMADPTHLTEAAQKKELTVLFSDIKSFTRHSASMDARKVRELLNEYFERMIDIVFRYEGTLDKFIGDGLMVFFGDPEDQQDHATRCVRAAIDMQKATRELAETWSARGDMPLEIRIGVNSGPVIVGNMGSERRLSYTALGEAVNLAQRLESNTPVGGILISERTNELIGKAIPTRPCEPIRVKGYDRPIPVYEVQLDDSGT